MLRATAQLRDRRRDITSYTNVCPLFSSKSDASIDLLFVRGRQMRIPTYRHYRICWAWRGHDTADESPPFPVAGKGFYKGRYCGTAYRPSDRGEYRLLAATADKPNVSHSLVSKSDRKQAAGCHLAPLSSLSRSPNIPRFDELSHFPSLRQQHVHLGQIEKDLT